MTSTLNPSVRIWQDVGPKSSKKKIAGIFLKELINKIKSLAQKQGDQERQIQNKELNMYGTGRARGKGSGTKAGSRGKHDRTIDGS